MVGGERQTSRTAAPPTFACTTQTTVQSRAKSGSPSPRLDTVSTTRRTSEDVRRPQVEHADLDPATRRVGRTQLVVVAVLLAMSLTACGESEAEKTCNHMRGPADMTQAEQDAAISNCFDSFTVDQGGTAPNP